MGRRPTTATTFTISLTADGWGPRLWGGMEKGIRWERMRRGSMRRGRRDRRRSTAAASPTVLLRQASFLLDSFGLLLPSPLFLLLFDDCCFALVFFPLLFVFLFFGLFRLGSFPFLPLLLLLLHRMSPSFLFDLFREHLHFFSGDRLKICIFFPLLFPLFFSLLVSSPLFGDHIIFRSHFDGGVVAVENGCSP